MQQNLASQSLENSLKLSPIVNINIFNNACRARNIFGITYCNALYFDGYIRNFLLTWGQKISSIYVKRDISKIVWYIMYE